MVRRVRVRKTKHSGGGRDVPLANAREVITNNILSVADPGVGDVGLLECPPTTQKKNNSTKSEEEKRKRRRRRRRRGK